MASNSVFKSIGNSGYKCNTLPSFLGGGNLSDGGPTPSVVSLDAPIKSALIPSTLGAYGTARLVEGFVSSIVRIKNIDTTLEANFGLNAKGSLDTALVLAWLNGADGDCTKLYDQIGSNDLTVVGRAPIVVNNEFVRFGVNRNSSDETLTHSNEGGVGIDLGTHNAYLISESGYTLTSSEGIEVHDLWALKQDYAQATSGDQYIFAFGHSDNIYFNHGIGPGSNVDYIRCKTTGGNSIEGQAIEYKANGMHAQSVVMDGSDFTLHAHGHLDTQAIASGTVTDIGNNVFNGSKLVVGAKFTGSSGAIRSDQRGNMIFGAIIITKHLSGDDGNLDRWLIRQKLQAIGYEHRIVSVETLKGYFAGGILSKDIETSGYTVPPFTGVGTFNFNHNIGSPDFDFTNRLTGFGIQGIRSIGDNNDNAFISPDGVPPDIKGTFLSLHCSETSSGNVCNAVSVAGESAGDQFNDTINDVSLSLGFDHNEPSTMNMIADSRESGDLIGSRRKADESPFYYDGLHQAVIKYNRNNAHVELKVFNEELKSDGSVVDPEDNPADGSEYTWDEQTYAGNDPSAPYDLDAPVVAPLAGNKKSLSKDDALILQIATFEAPSGYNKSDPWSTRKAHRLQSDNYSYISQGVLPGHRWGDIAHNPNGSVVDNAADAKIMSRHGLQQSFRGWRGGFAWSPNVFPMTRIEETVVNWYKLIEAA